MKPPRAVLLVVLVLLALVPATARASPSLGTPAATDPTQVQAVAPSAMVAGVQTTLVATLRDAATNAPVSGENLSFAERTTFGWLPLGNTATNVQGEAGVAFEPAYNGTYTVVVSFAGDASYQPSNATLTLTVLGASSSPPPLLPPDRAIVLVIVAVVGGVWATYGFVAYLILGIRSAGARPESESESEEKENMEQEPEASPKRVPGIANANRAVVYLSISALILSGTAVAMLTMGGVGHTTAYTPTTVSLHVTIIPDFRGTAWDSFVPDELVIHAGDTVKIMAYNEDTGMAHGFVIDALGVSVQLPAATQDAGGNITPTPVLIQFTVSTAGAYTWYCNDPCGPGHLTMIGTLVVLPDG